MAGTTVATRGYRVAELAGEVDVRPDTIRYYERTGLLPPPPRTSTGLLPPPPRTSAGYRLYPSTMIERLRFIQGCARLGLRLDDIAELLAVRDTGTCPCEPAEGLLRRRITEVDAELARLTSLRAELVRMADALPDQDCPDPTPGTWLPSRPVERR